MGEPSALSLHSSTVPAARLRLPILRATATAGRHRRAAVLQLESTTKRSAAGLIRPHLPRRGPFRTRSTTARRASRPHSAPEAITGASPSAWGFPCTPSFRVLLTFLAESARAAVFMATFELHVPIPLGTS